MKDLDFMARAIELAKKGQLKVQPNPMVGCVIVKNNKIVGEGWHKEYGKDHAELNAIKNCKKKFGIKKALKLIAGSNVYVNLEPCSIEKNTPPCSNALIEYQIKKLFKDSSKYQALFLKNYKLAFYLYPSNSMQFQGFAASQNHSDEGRYFWS
mgnify:CR=1 FL=1